VVQRIVRRHGAPHQADEGRHSQLPLLRPAKVRMPTFVDMPIFVEMTGLW
jgi:hypothetical protein